jgi:periplasmic divalent cation tolerance protein
MGFSQSMQGFMERGKFFFPGQEVEESGQLHIIFNCSQSRPYRQQRRYLMGDYFVVYVTCENRTEAAKIAEGLVAKHLAACASMVPLVQSFYWWEGKLEISEEAMLIIKTKGSALEALKEEVKKLHSYTVPEIVALPIATGSKDYLDWLDREVHTP